jgi:VWFA-related protein
LVLSLACAFCFGQDGIPIFKADVRLVVLHATVIDRGGAPIMTIPRSAFRVYENNVEQPVKIFRREDLPVSMGIIIDQSGSMRNKRDWVAAAALALVKASNPLDEVFVVHFNESPHLDQPFTNEIAKIERALWGADSHGNTALRDAIAMSIDYVKKKGTRDKKVLLVITDGADTASSELLDGLVHKARESEVLIYCIGLLSQEEHREAKAARHELKALARASGGLDYYPNDLTDVENITQHVAKEIRSQYLLAYSPSNGASDGRFRPLKVTVSGFGDAVVRSRSGYYAAPK